MARALATSKLRPRSRDAGASRAAILDAAEALFAERGYRATSLSEVGRQAGVSRGTPGYFFGSKERLYRAMLERAFAAARNVLTQAQARASASGGGPDTLLREGIRGYMDFLVARPTFVRLIEWETLSGGRSLGDVPAHIIGLQDALAIAQTELARGVFRPVDPAHMLISIMGLCWFPLAHAATLLRSLGLDPHDPVFIEARKRHVIDLVLHGIAVRQ